MDDGPLWCRDENGNYGLVFPNKQALTIQEIREIFSQFGTVVHINRAGDERGLRFVHLQHEHEADRAVAGLQNHPAVNLVPYRPKQKMINKPSNHINGDDRHQPPPHDSHQRNSSGRLSPHEFVGAAQNNTRKFPSCPDDDIPRRKSSEETFSDRRKTQKGHAGNGYNNVRDSLSHRSQNIQCNNDDIPWGRNEEEHFSDAASLCSNKSFSKYRNLSRKNSFTEYPSSHQPSVSNLENDDLQQMAALSLTTTMPMSSNVERDRLLQKRGAVSDTFSLNRNDHASNFSHKYSKESGEIPLLVQKSNARVCNESERRVVEAGEIIVSNIHEDYGSAYLLHLFEQYEPIAISKIREIPLKVPNCDIRYCHVYFRSEKDSLEVEKNFDQLMLSGKKLIVLRRPTLIREGRL